MLKPIAPVFVFLALSAGSAQAGGWATAGLAPPPDRIAAEEVWEAQITVLQHGRTPLAGVVPTLTIKRDGEAKTFTAAPTDQTGVYVARVKFPSSGEWRYEVNDGFPTAAGRVHTFGPVQVAARPAGGGSSVWFIAVPVALLAAAAGAVGLRRRSSARPASAPA
ncbi:MAG: hypothetical protein ABR583_14730 [Gaiellaceae bacterium]